MTEKLYDRDAALMTFEATVRECIPKGEHYAVLLDKTAFFPCEGGQGADHGTIGDARVLDARLTGDEILHILDGRLRLGCRAPPSPYADPHRRAHSFRPAP